MQTRLIHRALPCGRACRALQYLCLLHAALQLKQKVPQRALEALMKIKPNRTEMNEAIMNTFAKLLNSII
jgi:hypothetical protein